MTVCSKEKSNDGNFLPPWVYIFWKILGLCPLVFGEKDVIVYEKKGLFYTVLLTLTFTFFYYRVIEARIYLRQPHETSIIVTADFFGLSFQFFMIVTSWLLVAFRQNELRKFIETFKLIDVSLSIFGIDQYRHDAIRKLKLSLIFFDSIWLFLFCCDHFFLYNNVALQFEVWIPFNVPRVISHNVIVMFGHSLFTMKSIFHLLNQRIRDLARSDTFELKFGEKFWKTSERTSLESRTKPNRLEMYGQIHSELVTLTKKIVQFFSPCIILAHLAIWLLAHLILMASDFYIICIILATREAWKSRDSLSLVLMCSWFTFHAMETVILLSVSDATANEANRAGVILHEILTRIISESFVGTGRLLSLRLLHRNLKISLWGLLCMRLSVLHVIFRTVITYMTIMMQFDALNLQQATT